MRLGPLLGMLPCTRDLAKGVMETVIRFLLEVELLVRRPAGVGWGWIRAPAFEISHQLRSGVAAEVRQEAGRMAIHERRTQARCVR